MTLWHRIREWAPQGGLFAAAVLSLFTLTSCEDGVTDPTDLSGEWRLEELRLPDGTSMPPPDTGRFTVQFAADGQLSARADCNGCGGQYSLGGDRLVVSQLACTLIACPNAPFDGRYLNVLIGDSTFEVAGNQLTVRSARGTLRFRR